MDSQPTLLILITDEPGIISDIPLDPPLRKTNQGHASVYFELSTDFNYSHSFDSCKLDYRNGNLILSRIDWYGLFKNKSTGEAYREFLVKYNEACEECIPIRKSQTKNRPPWFNRKVERMVKTKRDLWHSCRRTNWRNLELVCEYKRVRNELRKQIRHK
ncbi:RNA-directed DNA polymerase from mobile element jockey-like [Brachionus plicatilis]|uniref:RNA-directed DNA polymerase from mobile element jockey-like n=1 Tax=Brachionus plicatilis TaxID=10195 RepID=A0A3M7PFH2_BRAPC|nr:RNA-directed DNA polymerase from mobile element jockey-like [Brachionus plicatilis]